MENWDDFRIFIRVATQGSIRQAAKALGVSHSTVLRRIDNLESRLKTRLFDRLANGYHLTQAGEDILAELVHIEGRIDGVSRAVIGRDSVLKGRVRLTMPDIFSIPFLVPHFANFHQKHPGIDLQLDESYVIRNLNAREADIAISLMKSPPDDLVGRKLGKMYMAAYATKDYQKQHQPGAPTSTAQWIGWSENLNWIKKSPFPNMPAFGCFERVPVQIACTLHGLGVGYLPVFLADQEPSLVRLSAPVYRGDLWVLYHAELRTTARIRCVRDFIEDVFVEHYVAGCG